MATTDGCVDKSDGTRDACARDAHATCVPITVKRVAVSVAV